MAGKKTPGLTKIKGIWHIDKQIAGQRICKSTGTGKLAEAERYLSRVVEETRNAQLYGIRPERSFEQAAARYILENQHKRSIRNDIQRLENILPYIGTLPIEKIHRGSLNEWVEYRQSQGIAPATINHGIKIVRRILNLAQDEWIDENGLSWLHHAPKLKTLPVTNQRKPYPLSWEEQTLLFEQLPPHLREMALFAVNTGCRDSEICQLRWEWEVEVVALNASVFVIPGQYVKNGDDRLVVLNETASNVIEKQRGIHDKRVFTYKGEPVTRMMNSAWLRARNAVSLPMVRVHDLKHTFGRRLRSAGVGFEDRQDLLGHRSTRMTTHYSAAELSNLLTSANKVCLKGDETQQLVVLRSPSLD
ncbi:MAG: site-specific integrase [Pseudomonadales bacterium]|nr:site-specific integrase [Pseudomonadales bacterium]